MLLYVHGLDRRQLYCPTATHTVRTESAFRLNHSYRNNYISFAGVKHNRMTLRMLDKVNEYRVGQKTGLFLKVHNFATVGGRNAALGNI